MARRRLSTNMKQQVFKLREQGYTIRAIARSLRLSRNTVRRLLREQVAPQTTEQAQLDIPWDTLKREHFTKGASIKQLHSEYAPQMHYTTFWREWNKHTNPSEQARIRIHRPAGERIEIDYTDGIAIMDAKTGNKTVTQLFCGVMAYSDYTFGEFVLTQKKAEFIESQERMFAFFGGVTPYLVVDNLKSGVHRAHIYDPDLNPTYCDYANATGFAVLPARPRTPRDKPAVEGAIGVIQRQFYGQVRNQTFYSLAQLNAAFKLYLAQLNSDIMKDYGVSRAERFEHERSLLKPLRQTSYQIAEYRSSKVHPDCHIQIERNFYSVPFKHIGQTVRVRMTPRMIEVFDDDSNPLAAHVRLNGRALFSTMDAHYPEQKIAAVRFDVLHAKREAEKIGPSTQALIDELLNRDRPLRFLRRVQGILRLRKNVSNEAIELASKQALLFSKLRLGYISDCARNFEAQGKRPQRLGQPQRDTNLMHLHQQG